MKKILFALAFTAFAATYAAPSFAQDGKKEVKTEKKKSCKKKGCCKKKEETKKK